MELFYIRNYISAEIAEGIIRKNNIKEPIAYIANNNVAGYYQKITGNMNYDLWKEINLLPVKSDIIISVIDIFNFRKIIKDTSQKILNLFIEKNINKIYLSNILSYEEKIMYIISKENNIEVNFYEEGINLYTDIYKQQKDLKFYIKLLLAGKYKYIYYDKSFFEAENVYCSFPEKYKLGKYKNKIKIELNFSTDEKEKNKLFEMDIDTLFLSRPLSEDQILNIDEELTILKNYFKNKSVDKTYIKFHPRESKDKIKKIKEEIDVKTLPFEYQNVPAEKLVMYSNIKKLVGYETGTLAYASELEDIKTYSLLKQIKGKSLYFNRMYDLYVHEFPNVKFVD